MATEEQILNVDVRFESDDNIYIAEVRELQGCVAMGHDLDDLRANIKVAIADYLELFQGAERVEVSDPLDDDDDAAEKRPSEMRVLAGC